MWDRVSKWKREHTGNWGKCVEGLFCGKLVFDRAGGAVPPVCIAAGKSDAWPERFRGDIWGGGAADTFLAKGCRDLAGSSCVGRVWRDICSRQPDFNDIPFDLDGICGHKGVFANLKRGGILLIQISVGSLYLFSVPRGYTDGFISWCKQVVGLCLTAFCRQ